MHNRETAFLAFWRLANQRRIELGQPEIAIGDAQRAWGEATMPEQFVVQDPNRDANGNWIGTVQYENGWTP